MAPHDFTRYPGGKELLESVASLTAKVDRHRAEVTRAAAAAAAGNGTVGCGGVCGGGDGGGDGGGGGGGAGTLGGGFAGGDSTLSRCTEETASTFSDSEEGKGLLGQRQQQQQQEREQQQERQQQQQQQQQESPESEAVERSTLEIEIEPGVMSLRGKAAADRDRRINPEFADM